MLFSYMDGTVLKLEGGIKLEQYVASCTLGGLPCNITRDFDSFFHPYYFNCYTYRKPVSLPATDDPIGDEISEDDLPWLMPGLDNGLSVVVLTGSGMLDKNKGGEAEVLPGLYDAGGATAGSDGVRVMIHPPEPEWLPFPLAEGFDVPPGFTASLSVRPRRNQRIGPPHGDCIDKDPFKPPSVKPEVYRQMMCQQRCLQQYVADNCHCYDSSLPMPPEKDRDKTIETTFCRSIEFPPKCAEELDDIGPCIDELMTWYERVQCSKKVRKQVQARRGEHNRCQTECRAACNEVIYDVSYSMARWPAPGFEGDAVYDDIFHVNHFMDKFGNSETIRRHFNETGDRAKALQDFARINVYVADTEVNAHRNHLALYGSESAAIGLQLLCEFVDQ